MNREYMKTLNKIKERKGISEDKPTKPSSKHFPHLEVDPDQFNQELSQGFGGDPMNGRFEHGEL